MEHSFTDYGNKKYRSPSREQTHYTSIGNKL